MGRKKKKSFGIKVLIYFFKGLWFLFSGIFKLIWLFILYVYNKIKNRKKIEVKKEGKGEVKIKPQYEKFDEVKILNGDFPSFESRIINSPSLIGIILGARGTGKSAIGMKLLENIKAKTNRSVCAMGFRKENLPNWIHVVQSIEEIPNGALILIDEAGIQFSSRKSMTGSNKILSDLLLIARHKDLSVLFISQNSSNLEINAIRQTDFLILKPSSLLQKDFERGKIKDIYIEAEDHFKELKDIVGLTYIYSDQFRGFVKNPLPSFWNKDVSKAFR